MNKLCVAVVPVVVCLASVATHAAGEKAVVVGSPAMVLEVAQDAAGEGAAVAIDGHSVNSGVLELTIAPHATNRIRISLSQAIADDFDIDLFDGATRLGRIPVKHKPFAVHLTDPKATVSLREGQASDLRVTNDDREAHAVDWTLHIDGRDVCGGTATIAAKSTALLTCWPYFGWGRVTRIGTLFRPVSVPDASLILKKAGAPKAEPPLAIVPMTLSANYYGPDRQQLINYIVVLICLAAGGIVSLLLGQIIPNRLARTALKERFDELARTISGLGVHTDSSLRVLLRVERSRLVDLMRSRAAYSPEFTAVAAQCSQGIDLLQRRTALVGQLEIALRRIEDAETTTQVSSTQSTQARAAVARAQEILRNAAPTDADFAAAAKAIADAVQALDDAAAADQAFQRAVLARVEELQKALAEANTAEDFNRLRAIAPAPADMIEKATKDTVTTSAIPLDRAATKLQLMFDYVRHARGVTNPEAIQVMSGPESKLLKLLQNSNVASIREAEAVFQQIRDGIYPQSLLVPLRNNEALIVIDPPIGYANTPLHFSVFFLEPAIEHAAAARRSYRCKWDFGDHLSEEAWEVTHYYVLGPAPRRSLSDWLFRRRRLPPPEQFTVRVTLTDEHGKQVMAGDERTTEEKRTAGATPMPVTLETTVEVRRPRDRRLFGERSVVELMKLAAALLIAVFGLVAGARDQIAKLDVLPGLVAVFLIGFGADTIKSLLSSKS